MADTPLTLLTLTQEDRSVLINALDDYIEWAKDAAEDKRNEARDARDDADGLVAEADAYDADQATARALLERVSDRPT